MRKSLCFYKAHKFHTALKFCGRHNGAIKNFSSNIITSDFQVGLSVASSDLRNTNNNN